MNMIKKDKESGQVMILSVVSSKESLILSDRKSFIKNTQRILLIRQKISILDCPKKMSKSSNRER